MELQDLQPVLVAVAAHASFSELDAIGRRLLPQAEYEVVSGLCEVGQRLLSLDAEDFASLAETPQLPSSVRRTLLATAWPVQDLPSRNTALNDLRPTFRLLLELVEVFLVREEYEHVLAVLHLSAEYLPLLGWQAATDDAGDPRRAVRRFGTASAAWRGTRHPCALNPEQRGLLKDVTRLSQHPKDTLAWRQYLLDEHSKLADVVLTCGGAPVPDGITSARVCRTACAVVTGLPTDRRLHLAWAAELSRRFRSSPIVEMRHRSPVGHFFSVPQYAQLEEAWATTWTRLTRNHRSSPAAGNPLSDLNAPELLPGLAALFSAVAGTRLTPTDAVATLADAIVRRFSDTG